jgi:NitT/TauT family transport system substrate-binding protein
MQNRFFPFLLLLFFSAGCRNPAPDNSAPGPARWVTLKGPSAMGMIQLIDSINHHPEADLQIDILDEPLQVRKRMLDGTADFALLPTTMAAILYNKNLDYRLLGIPVWGTLYLLGKDTSLTRWEDLSNKAVHVMARGMTPDVLFRFLLMQHGINPDQDIQLDYRFPTHIDLAHAVAAGQAELGVVSEPLVSSVMHKNRKIHALFDLNHEWSKQQGAPLAQTAFLGKERFLTENPQFVETVMAAYERSTRWVNQHPDSAAVLIVKYRILPDSEVARDAIPRSHLHFVRARTIQTDIAAYLRIFYDINPEIIGGKMPDENFYY